MNIREFAHAIGVSPTTVSRAINGQGRLSEPTRRMVLERMEELGFTPNLNAQRLSHGRTNMVALDFGIWQDYLSDLFFVELTREFQDVLGAQRYGLVLSGPGDVINRWVKTRAVDGVILVGNPVNETVLQAIAQTGLPCVVAGHDPVEDIRGVGSVVVDIRRGVQQVAQLLVEHGHRRIGFIGGPRPDVGLWEFRRELEKLGLTLPESYIVMRGSTPRDGARALCELLDLPDPPTAVFARTDGFAAGALRAAHQLGIKIPDELSIIGHDDVPFAELTEPPLTTVRVDCLEIARQSVDMLLALLREPEVPVKPQAVESRLVLRSTVAALWSDRARARRVPLHSARRSGKL